jgi:hypothetical protein
MILILPSFFYFVFCYGYVDYSGINEFKKLRRNEWKNLLIFISRDVHCISGYW